ncbi:hypothetical protein FRUB_04366 [Fimbriiglobus ruber]|uniref:Uncharacterized protein n=1 Tax=Fimbriiglobus ruber TaxID=1908690 RepID=A0A225DUS8_9BACT|nr:hypothetical protein FRUB_04366 [Fimbriiglobus ruber]
MSAHRGSFGPQVDPPLGLLVPGIGGEPAPVSPGSRPGLRPAAPGGAENHCPRVRACELAARIFRPSGAA